jgi:hypothetical protein
MAAAGPALFRVARVRLARVVRHRLAGWHGSKKPGNTGPEASRFGGCGHMSSGSSGPTMPFFRHAVCPGDNWVYRMHPLRRRLRRSQVPMFPLGPASGLTGGGFAFHRG